MKTKSVVVAVILLLLLLLLLLFTSSFIYMLTAAWRPVKKTAWQIKGRAKSGRKDEKRENEKALQII